MSLRDHGTRSIWTDVASPLGVPLERDDSFDVVVVGAGIAGLSTAYELALEGERVAVVERADVAGGMTARTTAHLTDALDDRYFVLEKSLGRKGARLAAQSHRAAIEEIAMAVDRERMRCDFERVDGYLFARPGQSRENLEKEFDAARRAGVEVEWVGNVPQAVFDSDVCLRFPSQAQFHPIKYFTGLVRRIEREGGVVYTGAHVHEVKDGDRASVRTSEGHRLTADAVVVATNHPINAQVAIWARESPYRTFVVAGPVASTVPRALYWDLAEKYGAVPSPYHYVRLADVGGRAHVIVGGVDHKTGEKDDGEARFHALRSWTQERFNVRRFSHAWSGQVLEPADGMAFTGRQPGQKNVFVHSGDSGQGITHGAIAGMLLHDLVLGRRNPWTQIYSPRRGPRAASSILAGLRTPVQRFAKLLAPGDVAHVREIRPGSGAIVRRGLLQLAVYKDERGGVHEMAATCAHQGCAMAWNSTEGTWDCPCHGSIYDAHGRVMNAPTHQDLKPHRPIATPVSHRPQTATPRARATRRRRAPRPGVTEGSGTNNQRARKGTLPRRSVDPQGRSAARRPPST